MALRAVVFDYGMVLTGPQDPEAHAALLRITGLPLARFESLYWADRHAYDEGKLTGLAFWQNLLRAGGLDLPPAMLAWQQKLKDRGLLTGILSNMGDSVLANMERSFDWLHRFDVLVWSFQLRMSKPDPAIYRHILEELGTEPEEVLFLDDRLINVEAAQALGMKAIQFSTVERLRSDLIAAGLNIELPLP